MGLSTGITISNINSLRDVVFNPTTQPGEYCCGKGRDI
jgi:hypothetical protein